MALFSRHLSVIASRFLGLVLLLGLLSTPILAQEDDDGPDAAPDQGPTTASTEKWAAPPRPIVTAEGMPSAGPKSPGMEIFDTLVPEFMAKWDIPGASIAVMKGDRLVFARSYGLSNIEKNEPMQPQTRMRIASSSKTITATAILQLVEVGKLKLDDHILDFIDLRPFPGHQLDPRFSQITLEELMQHTGGWERHVASEIATSDYKIARETGLKLPISRDTIIRYMLGQPLQNDPGTKYSYCNFGYMLLGRAIEKASGQSYESYVREHVLAPIGVRYMRVGHTKEEDLAPLEAHYYGDRKFRMVPSIFDTKTHVLMPYGNHLVENMDSCGGWIASSVELARFVAAIDGKPGRPDILIPATEQIRNAPPKLPREPNSTYTADGFAVQFGKRNIDYTKGGNNIGVASLMRWSTDDMGWVVILNGRRDDPGFDPAMSRMMYQGVRGVTHWPEGDLFDKFTPDYTE